MNYDQLKILEAIVRCGSFSAAAEKLFRTQPAVSIAIKKLEEEFGIEILSRDNYRPQLTPEGEIFFQQAKRVLNYTQNLEQLGHRLASGNEPEVELVISMICPLDAVLRRLKGWEQKFHNTSFNLSILPIGEAAKQVLNGAVDFAFDAVHSNHPNLETLLCGTVTLLPVANPGHFLAFADTHLAKSEVMGCIQVELQGHQSLTVQREDHYLKGNRKWYVSDYSSQKKLIEQGFGWGMLPDFLIQDELESKRLVPLKIFGISSLIIELKLIKRKDHLLGVISTKLWEELQAIHIFEVPQEE